MAMQEIACFPRPPQPCCSRAAETPEAAVEDFGGRVCICHDAACAAAAADRQVSPMIRTLITASARSLRMLAAGVVGYALPPRCPGCGVVTPEDHQFCVDCWRELDFLGPPACATCGIPFDLDRGEGALCGRCIADPPAFDRARAAIAYGPIARRMVVRMKHGGRPQLAITLARLMERLLEQDEQVVLAPVPLHRWRIWRRGFNQSALIAGALARRKRLVAIPGLLTRVKPTPMLRGLNPSARAKAVRGAFRVDPAHRPQVAGRVVVLVDDVLTTGATANACARALRRAGAAEVRVIALARVSPGEEGR